MASKTTGSVQWGTKTRTAFIQQSAELTLSKETAEVSNHEGDTVAFTEYNVKVSGSVDGYLKKDGTLAAAVAELEASLPSEIAEAFSDVATGGVCRVLDPKLTESNTDHVKFSCSFDYFPNVAS